MCHVVIAERYARLVAVEPDEKPSSVCIYTFLVTASAGFLIDPPGVVGRVFAVDHRFGAGVSWFEFHGGDPARRVAVQGRHAAGE